MSTRSSRTHIPDSSYSIIHSHGLSTFYILGVVLRAGDSQVLRLVAYPRSWSREEDIWISDFLRERCSLSPPRSQSVNRSGHVLALRRPIIGVGWDGARTHGHSSRKRFLLPVGRGRAHSLKTSPELSLTARPQTHHLQEAFCSGSVPPQPLHRLSWLC